MISLILLCFLLVFLDKMLDVRDRELSKLYGIVRALQTYMCSLVRLFCCFGVLFFIHGCRSHVYEG